MARPQKIGLEYFNLDTVFSDDKIDLMEAECGLVGFAILIKLWQKIYLEGYYIDWKEDNIILFTRKINAEKTLINSVVTTCFKREIFNKEQYDKYKILTSSGIQKRYLSSYKQMKRSYIPMIKEYLLVNTELTSVITELTSINPSISTQSKVKESKGKESKGKERKEEKTGSCSSLSTEGVDNFKDNDLANIASLFVQNGFGTINSTVKEMLEVLLKDYPIEWISEAIKISVKSNKRSLKYVEGILQNWRKNGGMKIDNEKPKVNPNPKALKTRFHNFEQQTDKYTAEELENVAKRKREKHTAKLKAQKEENNE